METNQADALTDIAFWADYWRNKETIISEAERLAVAEILKPFVSLFPQQPNVSFLELGGFPGKFTAYFKQHFKYDVTVLDYYLDESVVRQVEQDYGFLAGSISTIKADLFAVVPEQQFDVVTSFGLIEHFWDTKQILQKHLDVVKPGGLLFMTIPNFLGINGWVQKTFDPENLAKHNLEVMSPAYLKAQFDGLPVTNLQIARSGKGGLWLEPNIKLTGFNWLRFKVAAKTAKYLSKVMPKSRLTAPWVVIWATKK